MKGANMKRTRLYKKALQIACEYSKAVDTAEMSGDAEHWKKKLFEWGAVNLAFAKLFDVRLSQFILDSVRFEKENQ